MTTSETTDAETARLSAWLETVNGMSDSERDAYLTRYYSAADKAAVQVWRNSRMHAADDFSGDASPVTESSDDVTDGASKVGAFFDALKEWQTANRIRFDLVSFVSVMMTAPTNSKTGKPDMTTMGAQLGITRQTAVYKYKTYTTKYAATVKALAADCGIAPTA